jgi:DNA-binding SARP family transcriptional activator
VTTRIKDDDGPGRERAENPMGYQRARQYVPAAFGQAGLALTGEFQLIVCGTRLTMPHSAERVLAFLALTEHPVRRTRLAGSLWSDAPEERAANNLRTALWRLRRAGTRLVSAEPDRLALGVEVRVDVAELSRLARQLIRAPSVEDLARLHMLIDCGDLLPDWDDQWVVAERERFRLLRIEGLEHGAAVLIERHELSTALVAALAAVRTEPLRESARRLVVKAHIAAGNIAEAVQSYMDYRNVLHAEMGIEPSVLMWQLIEPHAPGVRQASGGQHTRRGPVSRGPRVTDR